MSTADSKVDKSSLGGDAGVSNLLKMNFLSSASIGAELVDQIRQADEISTFSSLSLEKQKEATFHLLKRGVAFAVKTIRNSSIVTPSSVADLVSRKDAYFPLEHKTADNTLSYDKLLARFCAYHKSTEESKFEATMDANKLGCLDCKNGSALFYAIGDEDIEKLCPNLLPIQSK
ncbi:unnamed protein product [Prunus armeniaca]